MFPNRKFLKIFVCFPAQRPKGAQTPSNCHISPKCWQNISNTSICIQIAKLSDAKLSAVPNCPRCQIVRGAKLSTFSLRCQIVRGAKLSTLHYGAKLSWCQIVHFYTAVPNCPPTWAVPNCPRCQIVRGAKVSLDPNIFRDQFWNFFGTKSFRNRFQDFFGFEKILDRFRAFFQY